MPLIIMNKRKVIRRLLYLLTFLLLLYVIPASAYYIYAAWGLIAAISLIFFSPLGILIYPFTILIKSTGNWPDFILNLVIVVIIFVSIMIARKWSEEYQKTETRITDNRFKSRFKIILLDIKRFIEWLLLFWSEFIGLSILLPFSIIFIFMGPLRELIFAISLRSKMWSRDYKGLFNALMFFFYLQIVIAVPGIAYEYFGIDRILDGIIVAGFLLTFIAFQFQRMTPPYFEATFLPTESSSYQDEPKYIVKAKAATQVLLFVRITNLGLATFKNCVFSVVFPEGFEISEDPKLYKGIDFVKNFDVQRKNRCIQFLPNNNYMTFPPCNHLVFPIWVNTPNKAGNYRISSMLSSESAWGEAKREFLKIDIMDD